MAFKTWAVVFLLIGIGCLDSISRIKLITVSWPSFALIICGCLVLLITDVNDLVYRLFERILKVKVGRFEMLLGKAAEEHGIHLTAKQLSGLTSNDIWALQSFQKPQKMATLNIPSRVAARMLYEKGFIVLNGAEEQPETEVALTELGRKVLDSAASVTIEAKKRIARKTKS